MSHSARALNHVAIIPDGNRRFAKKKGLNLEQAYLRGFDNVQNALDWAKESDTKSVTFWALSLDNFLKRSDLELKLLFHLMKNRLTRSLDDGRFESDGVRVKFFGKRELLPRKVDALMTALEQKTAFNKERRLNVAVAYSGREELLNAAKNASAKGAFSEQSFEKHLYLNESPDLVIRTGDVQRLSGLMPWQTAYSELYFSKKLWPEFARKDYFQAVDFYKSTQARFGS